MSKNRLEQVLHGEEGNTIYPFFWMHGEKHEILKEELDKIYDCQIRGICIEARPHPDFGGPSWWEDMDFIMEYAKGHDMKVWLLDDDHFPTGHANGAFEDGQNELANLFLTCWSTDVLGPAGQASLPVGAVVKEGEELIGAVLVPRTDPGSTELNLAGCLDVTDKITDGWLRIDVPKGLYRVILFYTTHEGDGKLDYFNILDSTSVRVLIEQVYEPHYRHYGQEFGKTFEGFFSDEPEFGNLPGYDFQARLGERMKFIPWSRELSEKLQKIWGGDFVENLPALWYLCGERTDIIRYEYMDAVTKQLKTSFSDQIHAWCSERGVLHVGHIIEDDNSHGRLGCSTGHYFRTMSSFDMAGIDVVLLQVMPGMDQETHQWVASDRDGEFFHYGLGKLGSSMAHINPLHKGRAMCEIFGAYGWQEGVSLMKWLADHMLVRGINYFVPHAFSPEKYPDPDCPPHFYASGKHMQYPYFQKLMGYINRMGHLLSAGHYPARTAVLYHADAEWTGQEAQLFQKPLRSLMEHQIDADVIPCDVFSETGGYGTEYGKTLKVGSQEYECLVIPALRFLPEETLKGLEKWMYLGGKVLCIDRMPAADEAFTSQAEKISLAELPKRILELTHPLLNVQGGDGKLRTYTYENDYGTAVFCFNEDVVKRQDFTVCWNKDEPVCVVRYDGLENKCYGYGQNAEDKISVSLEPGESTVCLFLQENIAADTPALWEEVKKINGSWEIYVADSRGREPVLIKKGDTKVLADLNPWLAANKFNGQIIYRTAISSEMAMHSKITIPQPVDVCEIRLNGQTVEKLIGPPYAAEIDLAEGENVLELHFPVTPVYESGDAWSALTMLKPFGLQEEPVLSVKRRERKAL